MGYGKSMEFGGGRDGLNERENFRFLDEDNRKEEAASEVAGHNFDIVEEFANTETELAIEITPDDIRDIKDQIERDRENAGLEGLGGNQAIALEGILDRQREEAEKTGRPETEFTKDDIKKFEANKEEDIKKATEAIEKKGKKENWSEEEIKKETESETAWIEDVQVSYLKKIAAGERDKKESSVEEIRWQRMAGNLKNLIREEKWDKVIPLAGQMNDLEPERFNDLARSLFDSGDKENMLKEVDRMKEKNDGQKANPLKLASNIRYISECFPDLKNRINISGKDLNIMEEYLKQLREQERGTKEMVTPPGQADYWKVKYMERNLKRVKEIKERIVK